MEHVDSTEEVVVSAERGGIPFDKVMPIQFKLIELMLPEVFHELVRNAALQVGQNKDAGEFGDLIYQRYADSYSQVFDDYCHEHPGVVKKIRNDEVSAEDYEHVIKFFESKSASFYRGRAF